MEDFEALVDLSILLSELFRMPLDGALDAAEIVAQAAPLVVTAAALLVFALAANLRSCMDHHACNAVTPNGALCQQMHKAMAPHHGTRI